MTIGSMALASPIFFIYYRPHRHSLLNRLSSIAAIAAIISCWLFNIITIIIPIFPLLSLLLSIYLFPLSNNSTHSNWHHPSFNLGAAIRLAQQFVNILLAIHQLIAIHSNQFQIAAINLFQLHFQFAAPPPPAAIHQFPAMHHQLVAAIRYYQITIY